MKSTIKRHQLYRIQQAISDLDAGYEDGGSKKKPFAFKDGGKVRYAACRILREVEARIEDLQKTRAAIVKDLQAQQEAEGIAAPSAEMPLAPKYATKFQEEFTAVLQENEELEVRPVPFESLDVDKNPVPISVLATLEGVLFTPEAS